ncbi:MAG: hypothetical protein KAW12_26755 [Candidatus Aminicenantes bacterium]|nr:hypothetical protein [Candidatus Aminicenantes bacterium]
MKIRYFLTFCLCVLLGFSTILMGADTGKLTFDKYHSPAQVKTLLKSWAAKFPALTKLVSIGKTYKTNDLYVLRIAAPGKINPDSRPAVFVSANLEGNHLPGTEAALMLISKLLNGNKTGKEIASFLKTRTVYIAPLLNPDAARQFFSKPVDERKTNYKPVDDDLDELFDEDGPDDLNKDGLISCMRVKDPQGEWFPDPAQPRLMRKADAAKGEKGIYSLYSEGLDNDNDGKYNEDPPGGVELNRNFPHDFEYNVKTTGIWPVSQAETIALVEFFTAHPNIALVLNFSTENTLLNLQQTGKVRAGGAKVKVPKLIAPMLGLDPDTDYSLKEIVEIVKGLNIVPAGIEVTEEMVAMFFGLGPAMDIDKKDMPYLQAIQKEYKEALKAAKLDYPQKKAKGVVKGSFAAYCYFQLGVQVFSTDLWAVPEAKKKDKKDTLDAEKLKAMSADEFVALGEEKIDAFLKEQGAPPNVNAAILIKTVQEGRLTPPKMAEMLAQMPKKAAAADGEHADAYILKWSDSILKGKGFNAWKPYKHPTLGDVEIGGFIPYLKTTPPIKALEKTISLHIDFYLKLMQRLPRLVIEETRVEALSSDLFQVTLFIGNGGWFPTSTAQGRRARTAWPIRVSLKTDAGQSIFSGRSLETIPSLEGSGDTKKIEWTIRGKKGSQVSITAASPKCGSVTALVTLK